MKLQHSIPLIFGILLALLVVLKIKPELAALSMALVPVLVIWQVVIALKHKEPASPNGQSDNQWYENP